MLEIMSAHNLKPFVIETTWTFPVYAHKIRRQRSDGEILSFPDEIVPVVPGLLELSKYRNLVIPNYRYGDFSYRKKDANKVAQEKGFTLPGEWDTIFTHSDNYLSVFLEVHGELLDDNVPFCLNSEDRMYPRDHKVRVILMTIEGDKARVSVAAAEPVPEYRYMIVSGVGQDGGYGDYSEPDFSEPLIDRHGRIVFSDNPKDAHEAVHALNEESAQRFYEHSRRNGGDPYDGYFPLEYKVVSVPIDDNHPMTSNEIIERIMDRDGEIMANPQDHNDDDPYDYSSIPEGEE